MDSGRRTIKAAVFDIGGVLAWDIWENMFINPNNGLAKYFSLDPTALHSFGLGMWEDVAYKAAYSDEETDALEKHFWQRLIDEFHLDAPIEFFISKTDEFVIPVKGMTDLVSDLKEHNIELGICSNNSEFFHRKLVQQLDFYQHFNSKKEILSSKTGFSKTSPGLEMFKALEEVLDSPKENIVFIDDRALNVERAIEFGFNALYFPPTSNYGADYLRRFFHFCGVL